MEILYHLLDLLFWNSIQGRLYTKVQVVFLQHLCGLVFGVPVSGEELLFRFSKFSDFFIELFYLLFFCLYLAGQLLELRIFLCKPFFNLFALVVVILFNL